MRFISTTPKLELLVDTVGKVLPMVGHMSMVLFMSFYCFSIFGMIIFQQPSMREMIVGGGPGDWGQTPWNSTAYGQSMYYYDLNFSSVGRSYVTLFMVNAASYSTIYMYVYMGHVHVILDSTPTHR